ncbi:MAG: spore coat protein CotJB [Eubacteriales bacterium]|nr:spore coat protein CotJB [Eubacteriales bacterium]
MTQLCPQETKLRRVQQLGFMVDDLQLFLDTHPQCREALCALQRAIALERTARLDYEQSYGPLTLEAMENRCRYDWISGPWPWEGEAWKHVDV